MAFADQDDLHLGVQRVARAMVQHMRLPDARMIVSFREMRHAANVELAAGPEYFIELNDRFKTHRRDIGAALAHEVTHVYLHRLGPVLPRHPRQRDPHRHRRHLPRRRLAAARRVPRGRGPSQKLGYLTPEEFGYVLAKRALAFDEDPSPWFTSPQAYEAYAKGLALARRDERQPPLDRGRLDGAAAVRQGPPPRAGESGHASRDGPPTAYAFERAARRCGCLSPAPRAASASGCRCAGGCGPGAGCAVRSWNATPDGPRWAGRRSSALHVVPSRA